MNDMKKSPVKPQATASTDKTPTKPSASLPPVKTSAQSTPIAKTPTPPAKSKKGGGFLALLMSVTALGLSAYLYLMIEKPELLGIDKSTVTAENHIDRIEELERRLDNLSKNTPSRNEEYEEKIQRLEAHLQRLHQRINEEISDNAHDLLSPASQLQFIDLGLRATGDAALAVAALGRIKTSNPAAIAEEVNRLEKLPNRERILMQIGELRTLTESADERQPEVLDGALLSLFNIRKIKSDKSDMLHQQITQMESLFISNRKNDYLQALSEATTTWHKTAGDAPDSNISALLGLLKEYGFPDYRLQLRFDEF